MSPPTGADRNSTPNTTGSPAVAASSSDGESPLIGDVEAAIIAVLLSAVVVGTLLGNASVILAVTVYDKMRTLSNALIASLASADLLVAIVVMPISLQVPYVVAQSASTLGFYAASHALTS